MDEDTGWSEMTFEATGFVDMVMVCVKSVAESGVLLECVYDADQRVPRLPLYHSKNVVHYTQLAQHSVLPRSVEIRDFPDQLCRLACTAPPHEVSK
jgi:hypothetical protein